jgi:hypothetical protein
VHKANGYRGWYIPEDAAVDVDGRMVPLPTFGTTTILAIRDFALDGEIHSFYKSILGDWQNKHTDLELQATYQYFYDRWLWDTDDIFDKATFILMEREIAKRKELHRSLATMLPMNLEADFAELRRTGDIVNAQIRAAMKVPSEML